MPEFEFNNQFVPQSLIKVEQLGQCAIEGSNEEGMFYYLIVRTSLGTTTIAECGPVIPDVDMLPDGYHSALYRMDYNDKKLSSFITKWLNDRSKALTEAKCTTVDDALSQFREVKSYMENYGGGTY